MKRTTTIPFDYDLCVQQSWTWWHHAWQAHFQQAKSRMLLGAIAVIGFATAMGFSEKGYAPIFGIALLFFAYMLLGPPISYLISKYKHKRSLRKIEPLQSDTTIAFDESGIRITGEQEDKYAAWTEIICFGTVKDLMVIYIDDPREPYFFSEEEVGLEFFQAMLQLLQDHKSTHTCWK